MRDQSTPRAMTTGRTRNPEVGDLADRRQRGSALWITVACAGLVLLVGVVLSLQAPGVPTRVSAQGETTATAEPATPARKSTLVTEVIDGVEWTTNRGFDPLGDPDAVKGGVLRRHIPDFAPTLRRRGPQSRSVTITDIYALTHEPLLYLHPDTLEYIPRIASHWRDIQHEDGTHTYWYRIDPRARFSDGTEVTADDFLATFELHVNPDIKDPSALAFYSDTYETPVVHSKYVVSVKTKKPNWRTMIYISCSLQLFKSEQARMPGDVYLSEYNWKPFIGTGAYIVDLEEMKQEQLIVIKRRDDYWAKDKHESTVGCFNFDRIEFITIRDRELAYEKLKKGEIDYFKIYKSQRWVEETNFEEVQKGYVLRRKVFNNKPQGTQGYIFNMREWPFDDINVRRAFAYAYNRDYLMANLMFNEYEFMDTYWPSTEWGNPKNRKIRYNPRRAARFLEKAGYTKLDDQGVRVHEGTGRRLEFTLEYGSPGSTRVHQLAAQYLLDSGIKMNLKLVDFNALIKRVGERQFTLHYQNYRALIYPNPYTGWHSKLANEPHNNNVAGFANKEVDALIERYDASKTLEERLECMHKIDKMIFDTYPMALCWYAPNHRYVVWNKFGTHKIDGENTWLTRTESDDCIAMTWYYDPVKGQALEASMEAGTSLPQGDPICDPWGIKKRLDADKKPSEAK